MTFDHFRRLTTYTHKCILNVVLRYLCSDLVVGHFLPASQLVNPFGVAKPFPLDLQVGLVTPVKKNQHLGKCIPMFGV
jgi:hypothetical protein